MRTLRVERLIPIPFGLSNRTLLQSMPLFALEADAPARRKLTVCFTICPISDSLLIRAARGPTEMLLRDARGRRNRI